MFHLIKSKGCRRCGGDLFLERDGDTLYVSCIQCSAVQAEYKEKSVKIYRKKQLAGAGVAEESLR